MARRSGGRVELPTWAIPYSSLKHYFLDHLGGMTMEYKLLGGWNTTAHFGHEAELFKAYGGGY